MPSGSPKPILAKMLMEESALNNLWQGLKRRAKQEGNQIEISKAQIHIPKHCPILGIAIEATPGTPPRHPNRPYIDRIDLQKGYTAENVVVTSQKAAFERAIGDGKCANCLKRISLTRDNSRQVNQFCDLKCNRAYNKKLASSNVSGSGTTRYAADCIPTEIISRKNAIQTKQPFYFTGKPCVRGHVAARRTNNGSCLACEDEKRNTRNVKQLRRYHSNRSVINKRRAQSLNSNPQKRIIARLRSARSKFFRELSQGRIVERSTIEELGCTADEFVQHIQSTFREGMTLENYGEWHLDHIKPLSLFSDPTSKEAWHYTNFQALWADENISKGGSNNRATRAFFSDPS